MKSFALLMGVFLCFGSGMAQQNFVPGKIISHSGDSISGYIYMLAGGQNPSIISFRHGETPTTIQYDPASIRGFIANDRVFVSSIVSRNIEPKVPVSTTPDYKLATDTVFLELLASGVKSLAVYTGDDGILNMYVLENEHYELLKYKRYVQTASDGRTFIVESDLYKVQLSGYLSDCEHIGTKAKGIRYTPLDAQKLFRGYYACRNLSPTYTKQLQRSVKEFGLLAGFNATYLRFIGGRNYALIDYSSSSGFTGGVYFNLGLPRKLRNFSIQNELQYTSYTSKGQSGTLTSTNGEEYYEAHKLGASYVRLNTLVRYKFDIGRAGLYVNAGLSNGIAVSRTNEGEVRWVNNGTVDRVEKIKAVPDYNAHEGAFVYGVGGTLRRLSLEVRREQSNGFTTLLNTRSRLTRNVILAGFRL